MDERDWDRSHRLCHPDARVVLPISDGAALSRNELVPVLRSATEQSTYAAFLYYVEEVDEHAACALGSFHRFPGGQADATPACWLVTFVDGLLFREALFASIADARQAYGELGIELGIPRSADALSEAV